jgi:hypothetical protein
VVVHDIAAAALVLSLQLALDNVQGLCVQLRERERERGGEGGREKESVCERKIKKEMISLK